VQTHQSNHPELLITFYSSDATRRRTKHVLAFKDNGQITIVPEMVCFAGAIKPMLLSGASPVAGPVEDLLQLVDGARSSTSGGVTISTVNKIIQNQQHAQSTGQIII